jgi:endonuclease YncB( thermonuclease family)
MENPTPTGDAFVHPDGIYIRLMLRHIHPRWCSRKFTGLVSLLLAAVLNLLGCSIANRAAPIDGNYRVVERVVDGDTLVMENGGRVRLIGVDTPETKHPNKPVEQFLSFGATGQRRACAIATCGPVLPGYDEAGASY